MLDDYLDRYVEIFGAEVEANVAVSLGRSRLVVVDCDTAGQLARFVTDAEADSSAAPTVRSPGQLAADGVTLAHRDGGHFYFTVPEGMELPARPESMILGDGDDAYSILWGAGKYVLSPPSVRSEGPYIASGAVYPLPDWLADRIARHGEGYGERMQRSRGRIDSETDPVAQWGAGVPWAAILEPEPAGWAPTGKADGCGCPTWTAPGLHGSPKSATAHEPGCGQWVTSVDPPLHIWTDNPGEPWAGHIVATGKTTFSKLQAVALLHYDGNQRAAMDALGIDSARQGFDVDLAFLNSGEAANFSQNDEGDEKPDNDDGTERKILARASQLWIDREARKRLAALDAAQIELPPVTSLDELLAEDDDPVRFRIDNVWPAGGAKVLCAAPAGGGKTTLSGNLVHSLADGEPFLDVFAVNQRAERIVVIDNEMTPGMLKRWLRRQGVTNTLAVVDVVNLRGQAGLFDLGNDRLRDMWTRRLADLGCDFLVFDCLKPVLEAMGLDENREMGKLLYPLTDMLTAAGVDDVLVHHHMGHANERARGDSTLLGWSDANWKIVRDDDHPLQPRYFSTDKVRDADDPVREGLLSFDKATGRLTYAGGNRATTHQAENVEKRLSAVLDALADKATEGTDEMNVSQIRSAVGGKKETTDAALALAEKRGLVTRRHQNRAKLYRLDPKARDPLCMGNDADADADESTAPGLMPRRPRDVGPMGQ